LEEVKHTNEPKMNAMMNVNKLSKDKEPVQRRMRRSWNASGPASNEESREISFPRGSQSSSDKVRTARPAVAAPPPPRNFRKQLVRSTPSTDVADKFLKSFVKMRFKKQISATRITEQPHSPSSRSHRESRSAYRFRPGKRIDAKENKSKSGLPPSNNFVDSSSSSYLKESSLYETGTDCASSSHSALELHDESEVSESSSTKRSYSDEAMENIEESEWLRISSPEASEEALVLQLKIPSWSAQHRLESLDVEYLVFKVPVMKTKASA
jgi:hypothetical protein